MLYSIEPGDHWRAGDRAYCLHGLKSNGRHIVEQGRIYTVEAAAEIRAVLQDGLTLAGVDSSPAKGLWSTRFVCIRGRELPIKQISKRTCHKWRDAYDACRAATNAAKGDV